MLQRGNRERQTRSKKESVYHKIHRLQKNPRQDFTGTRDCVKELVNKYPVLVRWSSDKNKRWPGSWVAQLCVDRRDNGLPQTIIGLVLTWILVSLGAPFWNDVLKGASGVNSVLNNGKKTS
jgi:hypothetical protein